MKTQNKVFLFLIFLVWPFLSVFIAIKNFQNKSIRFIIPLFLAFLGYTYQPRGGSDVFRSIERFESLEPASLGSIISIFWKQLLGEERGGTEIFLDLMSWFTHIFSSDWRLMLAFWGFLIGIILVKFYDKLYLEYTASTRSFVTKIFFIFLVFYVPPIWSINGRFWLAYWVYIYFAWQFVSTKEKKYLLLAFLPVLIHQATVLASFLLLFYSFTHKLPYSHKLYYLLIIAAIVFKALGIEFIRSFGEYLGGSYEDWSHGFTSDAYISRRSEEGATPLAELSRGHWFLRIRGSLLYFSFLGVLTYWRFWKKLTFSKSAEDLYLFILLFFAVQTFISDIPTVGGRYQIILLGMVLLLFIKLSYSNRLLLKNPTVIVLLPVMVFYFLTTMRLEFEQLYGYFFFSNPILALIHIQEISFIELIR